MNELKQQYLQNVKVKYVFNFKHFNYNYIYKGGTT